MGNSTADEEDGGSSTPSTSSADASVAKPVGHGDAASGVAADGAVSSAPVERDGGPSTGGESDASTSSDDAGHQSADASTGGGSGTACGARAGDTCSASEYCSFAKADQCGAADATGVCKARPKICPDSVTAEGFCGCDGKNYGNECFAERAGSAVLHVGMCSGASNPTGGGAAEGKTCAGIAGLQCASGLFCDLEQGQGCPKNLADGAGKCAAIPSVCTKEYTPVCGCDGKTYGNPCEAHALGASVMQTGACK